MPFIPSPLYPLYDVVLTHEKIPTEELRKAHRGGWQGTLECLEEFLAA